jgi:hypothetical protein
MPTATPLQIVKKTHGSKEKLVEAVVGLVDPIEGESDDDHKRRLRNAPNAKLLHLVKIGERVKELGGRDAVVKKVLELKGQPKDHEYADKLRKLSFGRLLDMLGSVERRAAGKAKKAPRQQRKNRKHGA